MKSAKDILQDLGFNKNAPDATKEAFLKNLINSAEGSANRSQIKTNTLASPSARHFNQLPQQLEFDLGTEDLCANDPNKKVS